jgi:glutamate N-acetyltransferase / amino-acid N-acetyltransferase
MTHLQQHIGHVLGFRAVGVHAGLKKDSALDFALICADRDCTVSGVFTTNQVKAAPVILNMERIAARPQGIRAIAVNTVSANACTGKTGLSNARKMARTTAEALSLNNEASVLVMSTGVIGTHLPMTAITRGIERSAERILQDNPHNWQDAATAIMTTDTYPKYASVTVLNAAGSYTIAGITKGAGMIAPNMATTLGLIFTDAALTPQQAQTALSEGVRQSYNRMTIDGDTSTNDMVTLMASGASGVDMRGDGDRVQFQRALNALLIYLAKEVVRNGEGVTKLITIDVTGAASESDAERIAQTIANSLLTKTAFFGNDANWGRIIAAAGRAGVPFDPDQARLWFAPGEFAPRLDPESNENNGLLLFEAGQPSDYEEAQATDIIRNDSVYVTLDVGLGDGAAQVWTSDLSQEYVAINADYRT